MAVYTDITDNDLQQFLARYDLGALHAFSPVTAGINNTNYLLETETGRYILTLVEDFSPGREALPYITAFTDRLRTAGLPCPEVISDTDGNRISQLAGKPALILSFLEGTEPKPVCAAHCRALGETLAKMHRAGEHFALTRPNPWSVPALLKKRGFYLDCAEKFEKNLSAELAPQFDFLEQNWPEHELPEGNIHADLFPDNTLFDGETLTGVIDFYLSGYDILAYDLAICVNAWCFDASGRPDVEKCAALLGSYHAAYPLDKQALDALPVLHRGAALRFLLSRLAEYFDRPDGALVTPHDPREYLEKLRWHSTNDIRDLTGELP
ncbi:MAG: homoserine kinase [Micavibrio sp.]|nr:MAG: homoserine kinase [Micavibrio sp.]